MSGSLATVGITDHAQHQLGDIVYVELPRPGTAVESGKVCGTVESVKAVSEIFSPVSGEVRETNAALTEAPETVNQDPHAKGWMIRVQLSGDGLPDGLLSAEQYEKCASEEAG